ncbi:MAG TPA: DUF1727 domain-containing protein [Desulfotomaculum sp.]|nr:MAG: UDP-N-acetylmuramyl peptide synthase [Desulfotomaculum sp. BICA1-6]HBX23804.1 DUF1727 domain-containing protein [Desulfotomaculum sp.]
MNLRLILAVIVGRLAMFASRLTGRGRGSSLPGKLALRIYPAILDHYRRQPRKGVIMVTGTNGKTTTNNMLVGILEQAGHKVVANREGANLMTGVVTAFIRSGSITGRVSTDYAVLEVDEAVFPLVSSLIKPDMVVVTNFFRDQLDRYGELDTTVKKVLEALKKLTSDAKLILNGDDPLVARLAVESGLPALFYGVLPVQELSVGASYSREAKFCPLCGASLLYGIYIYSQLGDYSCPGCGFARPNPDLEASAVFEEETGIKAMVRGTDGHWEVRLPVRGIHNLYNALAAFSASLSLQVAPQTALVSLGKYLPATGRMESFCYNNRRVLLNLVKNPTGFNRALFALLGDHEATKQDVLIAINDNDADGRDISWLWDVDFEMLALQPEKFSQFVCSGQRAEDMALRLKYAGVPVWMVDIEKDYQQAVDQVLNGKGDSVGILATYTALWPVEKILSRQAERVKEHDDYSLSPVS